MRNLINKYKVGDIVALPSKIMLISEIILEPSLIHYKGISYWNKEWMPDYQYNGKICGTMFEYTNLKEDTFRLCTKEEWITCILQGYYESPLI